MSTPRSPSALLQIASSPASRSTHSLQGDNDGGTTPAFHMTLTLPSGKIVDADVTYTTSRPSTLPGTPKPYSYRTPSTLPQRQPQQELDDILTAVAAALESTEECRASMLTPPPSEHNSSPDTDDELISFATVFTGDDAGNDNTVPHSNDDTAPLLPVVRPEPELTHCRPASQSITQSIGNAVYKTTATGIVYSLAASTAAPTALNALAAPSGKNPGELGPAWWHDMSNMTRAHSVANGVSSFLINIIMNALFLPTAWKKFRTSIVHIFDSIEEFLDNSFSMILALGGALAAAAIAYNAFLWLPLGALLAIIPAGIAFTITIAQRYVGVKSIFRRVRNLFNKDASTQLELADVLQHIDKQYLEDIEARFQETLTTLLAGRDGTKPLTEIEFERLLVQLSSIVSEMQERHPDLIQNKTTLEYITRYTGILFDMLFALLVIVPPSFLIYMQKGFDGIDKAKELITGSPLPSMHVLLKCLIGLDPALVNAIFYGNAALEMRTTTVETAKYLYQNPRSIAFAIPLLIANGFSSGGMQSVATGVVKDEQNLFHLKAGTPAADIVIATMTAGGGVVNTNATLKKAFLSSPQPAAMVTVADMTKRAANTNDQVICSKTGLALRNQSLFKNRRAAEEREREQYQHEPLHGPTFV